MGKRSINLATETTKAYDSIISLDKTAYTESRGANLNTLLRKSTGNTITGATGTVNVDFASYDLIYVSCVGSVVLNIQNVTEGDTRSQLVVYRSDPDTQTVTFTGTYAEYEGQKYGIDYLFYSVYNAASSGGVMLTQLNRQLSGSLILSNFSASTNVSVIDAVLNCNYKINDNILTLNGYIAFTPDSGETEFSIGITGFDDATYLNSRNAMAMDLDSSNLVTGSIVFSAIGTGSINFITSTTLSGALEYLTITGSIILK